MSRDLGGGTQARGGRKLEQVLEGARTVFLADGFDGASVDDIARAAGVSKATLYSYFPEKRLLFLEMARHECARHSFAHVYAHEEAEAQVDGEGAAKPCKQPPAQVLGRLAINMLNVLLSDVALKIFRVCVAEAERFPELGRQFFESGSLVERDRFKTYLRAAMARGELVVDDVDMAAEQWMALIRADLFPRLACNVISDASDADRERVAQGAVQMFLARYGVGASTG